METNPTPTTELTPQPTTPSPQRLAANRANALLSTGPRTLDGKSRSSQNALTHGLRARLDPTSLVPLIEQPEYTLFVQDFQRSFEFDRRKRGLGSQANQNPDQTLTPEGDQYPYPCARRRTRLRRGRQVVEHAAQRGIERDLQNHGFFVHKICG